MNLNEFLFINEAKVIPGLSVKFSKMETPKGTVMSFATADGKVYIIAASLDNFKRFEKWEGREAIADVAPIGKKLRLQKGSAPLAKIRTDVTIDSNGEEQQKPEEDDGVF